jgi:hypothetical protein
MPQTIAQTLLPQCPVPVNTFVEKTRQKSAGDSLGVEEEAARPV